MATTTRKRSTKHSLSPQEREQRITEAKSKLDAAVNGLLTADGWRQLIESRRWLRKYSFTNVMMILSQCPVATDVRPMSKWNDANRKVVKGSKALKIWAPIIRKTEVTVVSEHLDGSTTKSTEERDRIANFRLVNVFDVSQTDGEALPAPANANAPRLEGAAPVGLWDKLTAECVKEGFPVEIGDCKGADGYTDPSNHIIRIQSGMSDAHAAHTLAHELAHVLMGHLARYATDRPACEVEAESVACIVSDVAGMAAGANSVPYVAGWAETPEKVKEAATRVLKTADDMIRRLDLDAAPSNQDTTELAA